MLQIGEGEFWITGVLYHDTNGRKFSEKGQGKLKAKIKSMVKDSLGKTDDIYDPVYSIKDKIIEIANSFDDKEFREAARQGKVQLEDVKGISGRCVIGVSKEKEGYKPSNTIECYLKPVKPKQSVFDGFKSQFNAVEEDPEIQF